MKKIVIMCAAISLFGLTGTKAQGVLDKIDRTTDKVNRVGNTADRTKSTGDRIIGLFSRKKGDAETAETKTTIKISGATLAVLNSINEKIVGTKGVSGTKMKFNKAGSSITVKHAGSTDNLLKMLQKSAHDVFAEKNIDGLDDGEISVKMN